jgi:hypothetical protein
MLSRLVYTEQLSERISNRWGRRLDPQSVFRFNCVTSFPFVFVLYYRHFFFFLTFEVTSFPFVYILYYRLFFFDNWSNFISFRFNFVLSSFFDNWNCCWLYGKQNEHSQAHSSVYQSFLNFIFRNHLVEHALNLNCLWEACAQSGQKEREREREIFKIR